MATKELSAYILQRIRQLGLTKTQVIERSKLSRQAFYNILNDRILEETKLSTFITLAHALEVHPLILMRQYFHGWELPVWSSKDTKYPKDHSGFVRDVTYPDNSLVTVNQEFEKIWEIQNLGEVIWENRRLVCIDEELVIIQRRGEEWRPLSQTALLVPLQREVPIPMTHPKQTVIVAVTFRASPIPGTTVSYWKMVDAQGALCFPNLSGVMCLVKVVAV